MVALTLTMAVITQVASNPMWVFFFCNIIIVTILLSSKPPPPPPDHPHPTWSGHVSISRASSCVTVTRHALFPSDENRALSSSKPECPKIEFETGKGDDGDDVEEEAEVSEKGCCDEFKEGGDEDELRKRIEEFIEKTNKEWRAELIRSSNLVR